VVPDVSLVAPLDPEDEGFVIRRNVQNNSPLDTASLLGRPEFSKNPVTKLRHSLTEI
jgi:hypothetical protein